ELIAHELAVIFAHGSGSRLEARIGQIGACRPFPDVAEHLLQARSALCGHRPQMTGVKRAPRDGKIARSDLPFELGWQTQSGPPRERVGLIETHMTDRGGRIDRAKAAQAHLHEAAISLFPIKRRLPTLCLAA